MNIIDDAYRRFSTKRFNLPGEQQVADLEQRIGVTFPADYRRFVLAYNGGYFCEPEITPVVPDCPLDGLTCLHGIGASHREAELASDFYLSLFDDNDPAALVPIGHTGMGGLIILTTQADGRGEIYLKEAFGGFFYLADRMEDFFGLLREQTELDED